MRVRPCIMELVEIVIGCIIYALAVVLFIDPADIIPGSTTGIGIIVKSLCGFPIGILSIIINVPLILVGAKFLGKKLIIYSLLTIILSSVLIDWWSGVEPFTKDPFMCASFGGIILGIAMAFILHAGATTGGTSVVGRLIVNQYPELPIGKVLLAIDMVIMLVGAALMEEKELILYSTVNQYLCVVAIDKLLYGLDKKALLLISGKSVNKIIPQLTADLNCSCSEVMEKSYPTDGSECILCVTKRRNVRKIEALFEGVSYDAEIATLDIDYFKPQQNLL